MARLKDLPNELYLALLYQCHPREILTLITASSSIFRVFQRYSPLILNCLTKRLSVGPRPFELEIVAYLRHLGNKYKSAEEYESRCREKMRYLLPYFRVFFIKQWPSNLPKLAVLTDICTELDALTERIRKDHLGLLVERVSRTPSDNFLPVPAQLGMEETWMVQTGLLSYELYSRFFYHGDDSLHADGPRLQWQLEMTDTANFLPALKFIYNIHRNTLDEMALQELQKTHPSEKAAFLRYLTSFGIHFAHKVNFSSSWERREMILLKFSMFRTLTKSLATYTTGSFVTQDTRISFPLPDPYDDMDDFRYCELPYAYDDLIDWPDDDTRVRFPLVHRIYRRSYPWKIGPWFPTWGRGGPSPSEWWEDIHEWENNRWLTREYKEWMRDQNGELTR
ncbi:hypothetical protein PG984_011893 [Apiospora sp. TS-2023a]